MARQRISLVSEDIKEKVTLESRIRSGEINADNFDELSPQEQKEVNKLLFQMSSSQIEPNHGLSVLEFISLGFMRIMNKKINGMSLTKDERYIEESINRIFDMHELTNTKLSKEDWLFDYMAYAEAKSKEFLGNRKEHIERKKQVTGKA